MTYGLIRVSSQGQNETRQIEEMQKLGIEKANLVIEKQSGSTLNRPKYRRLKQKLKADDTLYIEDISRLGRNYDEILQEWYDLTVKKKVAIKVISNCLLDTNIKDEIPLDMRVFKDILLRLGAYQAHQEYLNIKKNQAQGIKAAKKNGTKFGRPSKEITQEEISLVKKWQQGEISQKDVIHALDIGKSTFYNLVEKVNRKGQNEDTSY